MRTIKDISAVGNWIYINNLKELAIERHNQHSKAIDWNLDNQPKEGSLSVTICVAEHKGAMEELKKLFDLTEEEINK